MNTPAKKHPLIRNIFILTSVLAIFLISIFVYFIVSHEKQTALDNKIRLLNDLSAASTLKMMKHLSAIRVISLSPRDKDTEQAINTKIYEINIDLKKLIRTQETYQEDRYAFLISRLSQQYDQLALQAKTIISATIKPERLTSALKAMEITLNQIYRLHTQQARLQRKQHVEFFVNFDRWILAFTLLLFLAGVLVIKKGTRQIKSSFAAQERMEQELRTNNQILELRVSERTNDLEKSLIQLKQENAERVHAEQQMKAAKEEAEEANQLKSEFLGRMSHELRTPMNAILGFGQLLEEEDLSDNQKENINEIMKAGWHLLHLIDEVLDLTVIESGKLNIKMENVALYEIVAESVSLVEQQALQRNIRIENYVTDQDIMAHADKIRTREVVLNLLSNAVKYNNDNGSITVNLAHEDNMLKLQVTDTGPGLNAKQQQLIFEPFNRLDAEFTEIQGVGVGLTIAKQLMELMQGSIGVQSIEDQGCTFWIKFQEATSQSSTKVQVKHAPAQSISSADKSILYIEDNPANLLLIKNIINKHSELHFLSSSNAELGIEIARSKRPDLVLLDLNLPGMNGYEALSRLRNYPETKNIPIIALSAAAMPNDVKRGLLAGFKHYITKPVNVGDLCSILEQELGSEQRVAK